MKKVVIETTLGSIQLELDDVNAPLTVENFLRYVDEKHYDGTIFHRVIKDFMIQGGGYDFDMFEMPTHAPVKNEAANGLENLTGTIAMARTNVVDSATSQFFINTADNDFLNHRTKTPSGFGYCVFGKVVDGMDTIRKIENVETCQRMGHQDVPLDEVKIIKAYRVD